MMMAARMSFHRIIKDVYKRQVKFRILEVNRQRHRAVGSIRSVLRDERKEQEAEFWNNIEEGKVYKMCIRDSIPCC